MPQLGEEEVQSQAAERQNTSPSALMPLPRRPLTPNIDVERADRYGSMFSDTASPSDGWLSRQLSRGLDYFGVQHNDRDQAPLDRTR